jgi:hypothetical protein
MVITAVIMALTLGMVMATAITMSTDIEAVLRRFWGVVDKNCVAVLMINAVNAVIRRWDGAKTRNEMKLTLTVWLRRLAACAQKVEIKWRSFHYVWCTCSNYSVCHFPFMHLPMFALHREDCQRGFWLSCLLYPTNISK